MAIMFSYDLFMRSSSIIYIIRHFVDPRTADEFQTDKIEKFQKLGKSKPKTNE